MTYIGQHSIQGVENISLAAAGSYGASRSFHVGNMTARDILPVLSWVQGEAFDLNQIRDVAYHPTKFIFQGQIYDLLTRDMDPHTYTYATSIDKLPRTGDTAVDILLEQAADNSRTLAWFWHQINQLTYWTYNWSGEVTTLTQKINNHRDHVQNMYQTLRDRATPTQRQARRPRYLTPQWTVEKLSSVKSDTHTYGTHTVDIEKIVDQSIQLLSAIADRNTRTTGELSSTLPSWPLPSLELITYTIHYIDAIDSISHHVGGQSMFGYSTKDVFNQNRWDIAQTHMGDSVQKMNIIPAHYYRFFDMEEQTVDDMTSLMEQTKLSQDIGKQIGTHKQSWQHDRAQAMIEESKRVRQSMIELIRKIRSHFDKVYPPNTKSSWQLYQLYQSQIDMRKAIQKSPKLHKKLLTCGQLVPQDIKTIVKKIAKQ